MYCVSTLGLRFSAFAETRTLHQSTECQREDWDAHRATCIAAKRRHAEFAEEDKAALARHFASGRTDRLLLKTTVLAETHAFLRYFRPHLVIAAVNAFRRPGRPCTMAPEWEDNFLLVVMERRGDLTPDVPQWARWKVFGGRQIPVEMYAEVASEMDPDAAGIEEILALRKELTRDAKNSGPGHSAILVVLQFNSSVGNMGGALPIMLDPEITQGVLFVEDPGEHFSSAVERSGISWRQGKTRFSIFASMESTSSMSSITA